MHDGMVRERRVLHYTSVSSDGCFEHYCASMGVCVCMRDRLNQKIEKKNINQSTQSRERGKNPLESDVCCRWNTQQTKCFKMNFVYDLEEGMSIKIIIIFVFPSWACVWVWVWVKLLCPSPSPEQVSRYRERFPSVCGCVHYRQVKSIIFYYTWKV